jgi:hypothetical protein
MNTLGPIPFRRGFLMHCIFVFLLILRGTASSQDEAIRIEAENAVLSGLTVNGQSSTAIFPATNGRFTEYNRGRVLLKDGQNTLVVGKGQGGFNLDFIRLDPLTIPAPDKPPIQLTDPDKCRLYSTWWSWFSFWSGSFIRNADRNLLKRVTLDEDVVTLDELPDWRREFAPAPEGNGGCESAFSLVVYPNPSRSGATLVFMSAWTADVRLAVFDSRGRKILENDYTSLSPGRHEAAIGAESILLRAFTWSAWFRETAF